MNKVKELVKDAEAVYEKLMKEGMADPQKAKGKNEIRREPSSSRGGGGGQG